MLKLKDITTLLAAFLICTGYVFASGSDLNVEEYIIKQEQRIENAAPDDWKTFADCANALISKRIVTEETLNWIKRSIDIRETVYNRTIKGDYLVLKGSIKEGQAEYVRAIELAKLENRSEEISNIQWKIMISMGVENFNKFQAENQ
jgi:hypothetical protein